MFHQEQQSFAKRKYLQHGAQPDLLRAAAEQAYFFQKNKSLKKGSSFVPVVLRLVELILFCLSDTQVKTFELKRMNAILSYQYICIYARVSKWMLASCTNKWKSSSENYSHIYWTMTASTTRSQSDRGLDFDFSGNVSVNLLKIYWYSLYHHPIAWTSFEQTSALKNMATHLIAEYADMQRNSFIFITARGIAHVIIPPTPCLIEGLRCFSWYGRFGFWQTIVLYIMVKTFLLYLSEDCCSRICEVQIMQNKLYVTFREMCFFPVKPFF